MKYTIAIDGPAGAGKHDSKIVGFRTQYSLLGYGAMYRAVGLKLSEKH